MTSAIHALINLSLDYYLTGEWDEAWQLAGEGVKLCEAHSYHLLAWPLWFGQAIVAAGRGDYDTAHRLADTMDHWGTPRRAGMVLLYARYARAVAALGREDFESAYHLLSGISPPGSLASHVPLALWAAMDLVEASVRTGRHAEAAAHSDAIRAAGLAKLSPRLALLSLGSAAIATSDDHATELFEQALAIPDAGRWPFDLARVQLAYGERLRRGRAITEARVHLSEALATFQRLAAQAWVARASSELRATGSARFRGGGLGPGELTAQERQIAELAATGLTNRQIGEKLALSHRTIGVHLYRIFPKLGVTSRGALRDALSAFPAQPSRDRQR